MTRLGKTRNRYGGEDKSFDEVKWGGETMESHPSDVVQIRFRKLRETIETKQLGNRNLRQLILVVAF